MSRNIASRNIASRNIAFRNIATAAVAVTLLSYATEARAQDADSLAEQYGKGVHAYFAGDYAGTLLELTQAINGGSKDPRCHYFRALALVKLGQADRADSDMAQGAELEILDRDGYYPVNRSLERVQGRSRLVLEAHRRRARQAAVEREKETNRKRYEQIRRRETDVLRRPLIVPLEKLSRPTGESPAIVRPAEPVAPPSPPELPGGTAPEDGDRDPFAIPGNTSSGAAGDVPTSSVPKIKARTLGKVLVRVFRRSIGLDAGDSGLAPDGSDAGGVDESNPFEIDE